VEGGVKGVDPVWRCCFFGIFLLEKRLKSSSRAKQQPVNRVEKPLKKNKRGHMSKNIQKVGVFSIRIIKAQA